MIRVSINGGKKNKPDSLITSFKKSIIQIEILLLRAIPPGFLISTSNLLTVKLKQRNLLQEIEVTYLYPAHRKFQNDIKGTQ